jgi:hypothetical protein
MRPSVIDLSAVICFGFAIAAMCGFRMTPRLNTQTTGCSAPLVSRGYSYRGNGTLAGYCLVFGAGLPPKRDHSVHFHAQWSART